MSYLDEHLSNAATRQITPKLWGHEELVHNGAGYCGKILEYSGAVASSLHRHWVKDEVLMVVQGLVKLEVWSTDSKDAEVYMLSANYRDAVHLEPGVWHRLTPIGAAVVYEWSSVHADSDVERLEESRLL